jgi:hypothetical protein
MATQFSSGRRADKMLRLAVLLLVLGGLLASCTYTRNVYELHAQSPEGALSTKDLGRACSIIDQIAAQERLRPVTPNDTTVIRLYREKKPAFLASTGETSLGLNRTADDNVLSFGAWLNAPGSTFFSRRLDRRVFECFESEFGANRVTTKTYTYPIPIGF